MSAFGRAYDSILRTLVDDLLATLRGIPDDSLNTWKPAAARGDSHEMNTFAAIAVHTVSAGEYMILHGVGGQPMERDRDAEFVATGTLAEIETRYVRWLGDVHAIVVTLTDADLDREPATDRYQDRGWRTGEVLFHAIDHTALHLGHLQVQRQLWDFETGSGADRKA